MSSPRVSRRTVATGAAWAVPVIAVGAAAPAMAASGCQSISYSAMSGRHSNGSSTVSITVTFSGGAVPYCVTGLSATGGSNGGVVLSYNPASPTCSGTSTVGFSASTTDNGQNNKGSFTGTLSYTSGGIACSMAVTFSVT